MSGFAFREIIGKSDSCILEWVLCLDLKGYIPRYVLDAVSKMRGRRNYDVVLLMNVFLLY